MARSCWSAWPCPIVVQKTTGVSDGQLVYCRQMSGKIGQGAVGEFVWSPWQPFSPRARDRARGRRRHDRCRPGGHGSRRGDRAAARRQVRRVAARHRRLPPDVACGRDDALVRWVPGEVAAPHVRERNAVVAVAVDEDRVVVDAVGGLDGALDGGEGLPLLGAEPGPGVEAVLVLPVPRDVERDVDGLLRSAQALLEELEGRRVGDLVAAAPRRDVDEAIGAVRIVVGGDAHPERAHGRPRRVGSRERHAGQHHRVVGVANGRARHGGCLRGGEGLAAAGAPLDGFQIEVEDSRAAVDDVAAVGAAGWRRRDPGPGVTGQVSAGARRGGAAPAARARERSGEAGEEARHVPAARAQGMAPTSSGRRGSVEGRSGTIVYETTRRASSRSLLE